MNTFNTIMRWVTHTANVTKPLPVWVTLTLTLLTITATLGPAWRATQYPATLAHELGHAYIGKLTGRSVSGLKLRLDTSGVTHTAGHSFGPGLALTLLAGYITPPLVGLADTWAALHGYSGTALLVTALLLALALPLSRNLLALAMIGGTLTLITFTLASNNPHIITGTLQIMGIYLGVAGVRSVINLINSHRRGEGYESDAAQLRATTFIPTTAWIIIFVAISLGAALTQLALITHMR